MKDLLENTDKLMAALLHVEDLLSRFVIPFVLTGNTARAIVDETMLQGEKITVASYAKELTWEKVRDLKMIQTDLEERDGSLHFEHDGIPVEIKVYEREYPFLRNPDTKVYRYWHWNIPNQWDKYWKVRGLIR